MHTHRELLFCISGAEKDNGPFLADSLRSDQLGENKCILTGQERPRTR